MSSVSERKAMPNPSVNRTRYGLRPPWAGHVERSALNRKVADD